MIKPARNLNICAASVIVISLACAAGLSRAAPDAAADAHITREQETLRIRAGTLERVLRVSAGNIATESLTISGTPLIDAPAGEFSVMISRASPNRNPLDLLPANAAGGVKVAESQEGGTDALQIGVDATPDRSTPQGVEWLDPRTFSAASWAPCFDLTRTANHSPRPGVQRLVIRARSLQDPVLAGLSINLIYEVYAGHPVIRKWVEIHNNSPHWLRLENLVIDDLRLGAACQPGLPLTPSERGATSSIVAFSSADQTRGVIAASEVPSALRSLSSEGASGYNPEHFEWILGPAESFVSEPTFLYGFTGEVVKTPSAESLPLDRAVEGPFKEFLRKHLGIPPADMPVAAPLWCSWTNFGHVIDDPLIRQQAEIAARCGFAVFQLDDGWQKDRLGVEPDVRTFPDFAATCDFIRAKGMRLGLWVSCFRSPGAADFQALPSAASAPEVKRLDGVAMSFAGPWHRYYANDLAALHDRHGATYFKQDFSNIQFGDHAAGRPSRSRKESLLRGLRGMLEAQSLLRHLAPDVSNEITHEIYWGTPGTPCDLAALKHAALYHIPPNDYGGCGHFKERPHDGWSRYGVELLRTKLLASCLNARTRLYAHRGLPLECIEYYAAATVNWKGSLTPDIQDRQICSWLMGAPTVFAGDLASLSDENIARYRDRFDHLKRLETAHGIYRRFQFSGVPSPTDTDWHWWGKLNKRGCGVVVVLRGAGGADQRVINIPWVDPAARYQVTALFSAKDLGTFTGRQLQSGELSLSLPQLGQELLELTRP